MRFLPDLFKSLSNQTFLDFNILVIDNGSTDGVEAYIREHYPEITILRNARNLGFTGAHNQGIRYALEHWEPSSYHDNFVLVTNPDLILPSNFIKTLMLDVPSHPTVGAFGGKLRRAFGENLTDEALQETIQSDLIDSTGLRAHKNRTFTDRGAGEMDKGQYDESRDVFGISGALVLYRASALNDIRFEDEFFDEDFFAYKEDVDLAFRLRLAGFKSFYLPEAVAYHDRSVKGPRDLSDRAVRKSRSRKDKMVKAYSYKNHLLMLFKNEFKRNLIRFGWPICWYEFKKLAFIFLFEQSTIRGLKMFLKQKKKNKLKRKYIYKNLVKVKPNDLAKWYE